MYHQQWVATVQNLLGEIWTQYPNSSMEEQSRWKKQLQQIKKSCDELLLSWATVEDDMGKLYKQYPELQDVEEKIEDEFFLDESSIRQFRQGQGYYNLTLFHIATPLFDLLIQKEPDFLLGRVYLGLSQYKQNKTKEAKYHFDFITQTASSEDFIGFAYHMLGCIYIQEGQHLDAAKHFSKAVSILPKNSDSWFNLAICYYRLERYQEAIPYFFQALSLDSDDWESMYYLSKCYYQGQQWENVSFWKLAAIDKTNHPRIMESIAHDHEEKGEYQDALSWYYRMLTQDRKKSSIYHGIAWNLWMLVQSEQAICWLKKGLTLFPKDPHLLLLYFWVLLQQGRTEKAKEVISLLPSQVTAMPIWNALLSRFFTQMGNFEHALELAEQLINQEKNTISALGYYQKGRILLEMKQIEEATQNFKKAREIIRNWNDPLFFEGICYLIREKPDYTRRCWEKINF